MSETTEVEIHERKVQFVEDGINIVAISRTDDGLYNVNIQHERKVLMGRTTKTRPFKTILKRVKESALGRSAKPIKQEIQASEKSVVIPVSNSVTDSKVQAKDSAEDHVKNKIWSAVKKDPTTPWQKIAKAIPGATKDQIAGVKSAHKRGYSP